MKKGREKWLKGFKKLKNCIKKIQELFKENILKYNYKMVVFK